jgi:hypothetical protein
MIRITMLLLSFAMPVFGAEESPLDYVINCLRIKANRGIVEASQGSLSWPRIIDKEPTALTPWHGNTAKVTLRLPADQVPKFIAENGFKRDRTIEILEELAPLKALFGDSHPTYSVWLELPRLGSVEVTAFPAKADSGSPKLELWITQFTAFYVRPEIEEAEQAGTGQPATRPESKSEGSVKPQLESEGRSR